MNGQSDALHRTDSVFVSGLQPIDPFGQPAERVLSILVNALLATSLFRCWHILVFFTLWATAIVLISDYVRNLGIQSTLITVFGTVLGFVISYRTSSSFERYNEGRRYWSAIINGSRTLSRTIWFHVPDDPADATAENRAEMRTKTLIEKKSAINLIEAFAVAVKHYLRGEESIYYEDLFHLIKFLPPYALPAGRPSSPHGSQQSPAIQEVNPPPAASVRPPTHRRTTSRTSDSGQSITILPFPNLTPSRSRQQPHIPTLSTIPSSPEGTQTKSVAGRISQALHIDTERVNTEAKAKEVFSPHLTTGRSRRSADEPLRLLPSRDPPKHALFDIFPFSLFVALLTDRGVKVKGKKGARMQARRAIGVSHNIPLEITFYLSSYISALQIRKAVDVPTINTMLLGLNQLVDSLTGLERILTTPIPFSYSIHLWSVTTIYCFVLPFQLWLPLRYLTIPATAITAFIFYGFLVAGEEIENPFGYDKNDLNLDHFTQNIIRAELNALTCRAMPDVTEWVFHHENDAIFAGDGVGEKDVPPKEWLNRGEKKIREVLARSDR